MRLIEFQCLIPTQNISFYFLALMSNFLRNVFSFVKNRSISWEGAPRWKIAQIRMDLVPRWSSVPRILEPTASSVSLRVTLMICRKNQSLEPGDLFVFLLKVFVWPDLRPCVLFLPFECTLINSAHIKKMSSEVFQLKLALCERLKHQISHALLFLVYHILHMLSICGCLHSFRVKEVLVN